LTAHQCRGHFGDDRSARLIFSTTFLVDRFRSASHRQPLAVGVGGELVVLRRSTLELRDVAPDVCRQCNLGLGVMEESCGVDYLWRLHLLAEHKHTASRCKPHSIPWTCLEKGTGRTKCLVATTLRELPVCSIERAHEEVGSLAASQDAEPRQLGGCLVFEVLEPANDLRRENVCERVVVGGHSLLVYQSRISETFAGWRKYCGRDAIVVECHAGEPYIALASLEMLHGSLLTSGPKVRVLDGP